MVNQTTERLTGLEGGLRASACSPSESLADLGVAVGYFAGLAEFTVPAKAPANRGTTGSLSFPPHLQLLNRRDIACPVFGLYGYEHAAWRLVQD
jgi:hypothetical protein